MNFRPHVESEWESFTTTVDADDSDEEDEIETWWRNKITGHEQNVKPSGGKHMPIEPNQMIKVGCGYAICPKNRLSLAKADAPCASLPSQHPWTRLDRPVRALRSSASTSRRMGLRSSLGSAQGRSKSGIQVRFGPQIAPPWPQLTLAGLPGSYAGSHDAEDQRQQPLHQLGRIFARWHEDCVRLRRQDDQSLGFRCVLGPKSPLLGQN